jgi:hypothetical protein
MASVNDESLRYGISALDLTHKDIAVKDEMLIHNTDGKIHYKRETDGQIVSYDALEYSNQELISAMNGALTEMNVGLNPPESDLIAYHVLNIAGKTSILNTVTMEFGYSSTFTTANIQGFYIRVRGNNKTNAVVSYLESLQKNTDSVEFTFSITAHGSTNVTKTVTRSGGFNKLLFVEIPDFDVSNIKTYEIQVVSIFYNLYSTYNKLSTTQKNLLSSFNDLNAKFEADAIDLVTYVEALSNTVIYSETDDIKLHQAFSVNTMVNETSESIIVSKEKPTRKCLWVKLK